MQKKEKENTFIWSDRCIKHDMKFLCFFALTANITMFNLILFSNQLSL